MVGERLQVWFHPGAGGCRWASSQDRIVWKTHGSRAGTEGATTGSEHGAALVTAPGDMAVQHSDREWVAGFLCGFHHSMLCDLNLGNLSVPHGPVCRGG